MAKQNLGMVTAYAYAVMGGYEGTEAEFEALLGNIATDLAEIENLTVVATTLPAGSSATASYSDGVLTLGIPRGNTGATGAGATVAVGSTSTGNPGTNASVTNSGTSKDAIFNFTIPRGNTGNGIDSIYLTGTSGAVKTYTILFTDGNTTTFDVTDGEVTNAALTAILADYAKVDGAYEAMTVGNAEQLVSTVFVEDEEPYTFRTAGGSADIGDREYDTIVGGTLAWNQLVQNGNFADTSYWAKSDPSHTTFSVSGNVGTVTITDNSSNGRPNINLPQAYVPAPIVGHKYLITLGYKITSNTSALTGRYLSVLYGDAFTLQSPLVLNAWTDFTKIVEVTTTTYKDFSIYNSALCSLFSNGDTFEHRNIQCIDLTAMFGSTIADYIYTLEQGTAGAGVAWFRKLFPKPYYAYNAGELMSVNTSAHNTVGFNQFDGETESGYWDTEDGTAKSSSNFIRSKNAINCVPNTIYHYYNEGSGSFGAVLFYDANDTYIGYATLDGSGNFTTNANSRYMRFYANKNNTNICINLHWDGERDGEYEEYVEHEYPLDSSLTLRGIPKLDANNSLYYDGDVYESDGTVARRFALKDLGELSYTFVQHQTFGDYFYADVSSLGIKRVGAYSTTIANIMCALYDPVARNATDFLDMTMTADGSNSAITQIQIKNSAYTDAAAFKTAMDGVYLIYELATPTTETADPFQSPQIVDDFGTEEYTVTEQSGVAVPVGHQTKYTNNLRAKLEMSPDSPSGNGDYLVRQTNGLNEYVQFVPELPTKPSTNGTYVLKATVSGGVASLSWVEE